MSTRKPSILSPRENRPLHAPLCDQLPHHFPSYARPPPSSPETANAQEWEAISIMHALFQNRTTFRRRRTWPPLSGEQSTALTIVPKPHEAAIGPERRPRARGRSRNCSTAKKDAKAATRRRQAQGDDVSDNQRPEEGDDSDDDADTLQSELRAMQEEVEALQRRRVLLESALVNRRTNAVAHAIDLTKGFYVHFSNGFDPVAHPTQCREAETFLRGIMKKDVICTEFQGVDLFLNQYKACTEGHASMRVFVHGISVINEELSSRDGAIQILAKAVAHFRVSRATLERFFPCIIEDEEMAQQLIGKEYAIQYDKVFHFQDGRVFQHESQVDFCNSMLEMAQNPFVAMKLLEASLMTKHGHLKLDNNIEEDKNQLENLVL
ncbi:hypothetical protein BBJ28_00005815 [Nothophytophthora sp. Chile5]|nr:hypothetical protein BBJ28_00005815 [Nothophytophthora sp. Chile5]